MTLSSLVRNWVYSSEDYETWIETVERAQDPPDLDPAFVDDGPLISVVVPCYNPRSSDIGALVASLIAQRYPQWQLCLADGSEDSQARAAIRALAARDSRITYLSLPENLGIAGNTNRAIAAASGQFVAFADQDDTLSPFALLEVVRTLAAQPELDLVYSDEDKLSEDGTTRLLPHFKPQWSPDLLLGINYVTHFVVVRKSLLDAVGGLRIGFDGAQDYDLLLRVAERTDRIAHIPRILYHWRLAPGSSAQNLKEKSYADAAGQRALRDALQRRGIAAEVEGIPDRPTNYHVKYQLPSPPPKVSVLIPFKDKVHLLERCVESILSRSTYPDYEILLLSNNSVEPATHRYLRSLPEDRCRNYAWDHPFNYAAINNFGSERAAGDYLILLNNDTEVLTPDWIQELVGVAAQPGVGAVGALLRYPNRRIQHAGVVLGMAGMAGHVFRHLPPTEPTAFGIGSWPRNYLAVTGACLAVSRSTYREVGGLDESLVVAGNDVAFCLMLHEAGYRNVYWPFAELVHHESASVGSYDAGIRADHERARRWYGPYLDGRDPYFNPNLDLDNEQIGLQLPNHPSAGRQGQRALKALVLRALRFQRAYRNQGLSGVARKLVRKTRLGRGDQPVGAPGPRNQGS